MAMMHLDDLDIATTEVPCRICNYFPKDVHANREIGRDDCRHFFIDCPLHLCMLFLCEPRRADHQIHAALGSGFYIFYRCMRNREVDQDIRVGFHQHSADILCIRYTHISNIRANSFDIECSYKLHVVRTGDILDDQFAHPPRCTGNCNTNHNNPNDSIV